MARTMELGASLGLGAPLQRLPAEILDAVISQPCLMNEDVKSLRLASKTFERLCARHLFRQISISALRRDWDAFLSIAHSPALACFTQTLVWQELSGNFEYLRDQGFERALGWTPRQNSADDDNTLSTLAAQVEPLFWLTPEHTTALNNGDKEPVECLPYWNAFVDAIDKFPSLRLLVSQPMHPDRPVQLSTGGYHYPLTARAIISFLQFPLQWEGFTGFFNLGFLFYLIPLLKLYAGRGDAQRWELSFTEETEMGGTSLEHLRPQDASAFKHLDHLQLRMFEGNVLPARDISGLAAGLAQAVNLTHFHLRYTQSRKSRGITIPASDSLHRSPLYEIPTLPSLRFLCLDEVVLENSYLDTPENNDTWALDHKQPAFVDIVKRHAATLKSLYVFASAVTEDSVRELAKIRDLKLERFVMTRPDCGSDACAVDEAEVLKFINWKPEGPAALKESSLQIVTSPTCPSFSAQPYTHELVEAWQDWVAESDRDGQPCTTDRREKDYDDIEYLDECGEHEAEDAAHEICRSFDEETGLWVDAYGVYYDPRTDQEMTQYSRQSPYPDDWEVRNDRQWDNKLGLWRDILRGDNLQLHRFAIDRSAITNLENDPDQYNENEPGLDGEYYSIIDENPAYPQEISVQEDFEYHSRHLLAPRWAYGRNTEHKLCYWEVYGGHSGHPTEVWHFLHRNGEEAYGHDPLDFWPDWKGNAWGDKAIATPFGRHLKSFYQNDLSGGDEGAKATELPTQEEIGIEYGEPIVFEPRDEPTGIWGPGHIIY